MPLNVRFPYRVKSPILIPRPPSHPLALASGPPTVGLAVWLDPNRSAMTSDQAGTTPATVNGAIVRAIAGVGGLGSASGNPADAEAARIDAVTYPRARAIYLGGGPTTFAVAGYGGTEQSFTVAMDYATLSEYGGMNAGTVNGPNYGAGEEPLNRLMGFRNRGTYAVLTGYTFPTGRRRLIIRGTPSAMTFRINGADHLDAAGTTAAIASGTIGDQAVGGAECQMVLREYLAYDRALSDAECDQLDSYWLARPAPNPLPASMPAVIADGNSITIGFIAGNSKAWPCRLEALIGRSAVRVKNVGAVAYQTTQLIVQAPTVIDPFADPARRTVLVLQEGTNHINIGGADGPTAYAAMASYLAARQAAWPASTRYVLSTICPGTVFTSAGEVARQSCNASLRDNWAALGAHGLIDWESDSRLADPADATHFEPDGTHWTPAGEAVGATLARAVIQPLLS